MNGCHGDAVELTVTVFFPLIVSLNARWVKTFSITYNVGCRKSLLKARIGTLIRDPRRSKKIKASNGLQLLVIDEKNGTIEVIAVLCI